MNKKFKTDTTIGSQLMKKIMLSLHNPVAYIAPDFSYIEANTAYISNFKLKPESYNHDFSYTIAGEANSSKIREKITDCFKGKETQIKLLVNTPQGEKLFDINYYPVSDINGSINLIICVAQDDTDYFTKESEEDIPKLSYYEMIHKMERGIMICKVLRNEENEITDFYVNITNNAFRNIFKSIDRMRFSEVFDQNYIQKFISTIKPTIEEDKSVTFFDTIPETKKYVRTNVMSLRKDYIAVALDDLTNINNTINALQSQDNLLRSLLLMARADINDIERTLLHECVKATGGNTGIIIKLFSDSNVFEIQNILIDESYYNNELIQHEPYSIELIQQLIVPQAIHNQTPIFISSNPNGHEIKARLPHRLFSMGELNNFVVQSITNVDSETRLIISGNTSDSINEETLSQFKLLVQAAWPFVEKKNVSEAHLQIIETLNTIMEKISAGILIVDKNKEIVYANSYAIEIAGQKDSSKLLGKKCYHFFPGASKSTCPIWDLKKNKIGGEYVIHHPVKGKIPIYKTAAKIQLDGQDYLLEFFMDISDRKDAQKEQQNSEKKFKDIFASSPIGIAYLDPNGDILNINKAATEILQISSTDSLIGFNIFSDIEGKFRFNREQIIRILKKQGLLQETIFIRSFSQQKIALNIYIKPIMRDGDLQNMLLIFEDVTQLELTRKELIQAKESAEQSDKLKTSFLQNLSHEVRTPLNGIMGFAELLNEGQNSENEILVFSQQILKNGYRLIEMIENLIDISQIETNQISYEHSSFKLKDLFSEIYEEYRGIAQEKNLEFMLNTSAITETHLMGSDRKKLYKVFRILLSNAFKFTDTGHIIFGCRYSNEFFEIYVKDTGIGIPSEMQHQVFKRFEQTENYESRKHGGNGIGLSICQEFTRLMRAKIILESETGIGSVFTIRFPKSVISELASI